MRSQLTLTLLAAIALLLATAPGQAQTYQDYASGQAYVMTSPVLGSSVAPGRTPSYRDYANGRAFGRTAPGNGYSPPLLQGPTYQDYANGRAYVMTAPAGGYDTVGNRPLGDNPSVIVLVPSTGNRDPRLNISYPPQTPSITTTLARTPYMPSAASRMSATPRMYSHTPSPVPYR